MCSRTGATHSATVARIRPSFQPLDKPDHYPRNTDHGQYHADCSPKYRRTGIEKIILFAQCAALAECVFHTATLYCFLPLHTRLVNFSDSSNIHTHACFDVVTG